MSLSQSGSRFIEFEREVKQGERTRTIDSSAVLFEYSCFYHSYVFSTCAHWAERSRETISSAVGRSDSDFHLHFFIITAASVRKILLFASVRRNQNKFVCLSFCHFPPKDVIRRGWKRNVHLGENAASTLPNRLVLEMSAGHFPLFDRPELTGLPALNTFEREMAANLIFKGFFPLESNCGRKEKASALHPSVPFNSLDSQVGGGGKKEKDINYAFLLT